MQNKCEIIDRFKVGDIVKVSFNIKGNKWERDGKVNYITNLDSWRIEKADEQPAPRNEEPARENHYNAPPVNPSPETIDDLPF